MHIKMHEVEVTIPHSKLLKKNVIKKKKNEH